MKSAKSIIGTLNSPFLNTKSIIFTTKSISLNENWHLVAGLAERCGVAVALVCHVRHAEIESDLAPSRTDRDRVQLHLRQNIAPNSVRKMPKSVRNGSKVMDFMLNTMDFHANNDGFPGKK